MSEEAKATKTPVLAIAEHAQGRTDAVRKKLQNAMRAIEKDIDDNDMIYPYCGGRLSLSEVCRRAGVNKMTMQGYAHRTTTKIEIQDWIERTKNTIITGRKSVRKAVTERANDWETQFKTIANKFNEMYAIEIPSRDNKIKQLTERIRLLEAENLRLDADRSGGKVIRMPNRDAIENKGCTATMSIEGRLVLIRGVPGSGKSTLAKNYTDCVHLEADMFFIKDGQYIFDELFLPAAHQWCLENTRKALAAGKHVVVSNVFASAWEVKPYIDLGASYEIIEANGRWTSVHGVPPERIERMRQAWIPSAQLIKEISNCRER